MSTEIAAVTTSRSIRNPVLPGWIDLRSRPSHLRVHGGRSPVDEQTPSPVARRAGAARCSLETVEFDPGNHRHLASLTGYYNTQNWHYLYLTRADDGRTGLEPLGGDGHYADFDHTTYRQEV
ncbi:hypothetical protein AB0M35_05460 [Micromonospora sp. NPDC051196]|uniref:beta-xylosidase family glycoside hydrolase n=1 Tax=Micromonospora sp. NPDC051196 TaxID=3155281 RepID=UPI003417D182